jgi:hypothetical protein
MTKDAAIFLCNKTPIMAAPWAEAGFECWLVDIEHSIRRDREERVGSGLIRYVWGDVRSWRLPSKLRGRVAFGCAMTPCTDIALCNARDFQKKAGWMLSDAIQLFDSAETAFSYGDFPYFLENPKSRLTTHRRKFDFKFQPWHYGDPWFKETWLWTGGGFRMPPATHLTPPEGTTEKIWLMAPSEDRADLRSETPPGFAKAVFEANCPKAIRAEIEKANH